MRTFGHQGHQFSGMGLAMGAVQIGSPDSKWVLCGHAVTFPH